MVCYEYDPSFENGAGLWLAIFIMALKCPYPPGVDLIKLYWCKFSHFLKAISFYNAGK
jgi:hypothetical protein